MKMEGPYWVYTHTCPNGMVYVGCSGAKNTYDRWGKNRYRASSLEPYIEEFGWDNIIHKVVFDCIKTDGRAKRLENYLIDLYREMGCCINERCGNGKKIKTIKIHQHEKIVDIEGINVKIVKHGQERI